MRLFADPMMTSGRKIYITTGDYSDYRCRGFFEVLENFSIDEQKALWIETLPPEDREYSFECKIGYNHEAFIAFLMQQKLITEIDAYETHLDDFDD